MSATIPNTSAETKTDAKGQPQLSDVPQGLIKCDLDWNGRNKVFVSQTATEDKDLSDKESSSFGMLKASIAANGQNDPIEIRPNPSAKTDKKPFMVVAGHRRFVAVQQLNDEKTPPPGMMRGTIRCIVLPEMSELDALWRNSEENINRQETTYADRVQWYKVLKAQNENLKPDDFRTRWGVSQGYVSKIENCAKGLTPQVFESWRNSTVGIKGGIDAMVRISKIEDPGAQWKAWEEAKGAGSPSTAEKTEDEKRAEKVKSVTAKAAEIGRLIGTLAKLEVIDVDHRMVDWTAVLPELGVALKDATLAEKKEIRDSAYNACDHVINPPAQKEEEEKGKGKGKGKSGEISAN
jgi:ParB-like nuclease domain